MSLEWEGVCVQRAKSTSEMYASMCVSVCVCLSVCISGCVCVQADCHNFIRVLVLRHNELFVCGTNAFSPRCSWRQVGNQTGRLSVRQVCCQSYRQVGWHPVSQTGESISHSYLWQWLYATSSFVRFMTKAFSYSERVALIAWELLTNVLRIISTRDTTLSLILWLYTNSWIISL